jgi:hypothetical protein
MGRRFNVDDRQVLDRGQTLDWLENRFIVVFLSVAVLALMAAAVWEWRYPDPVVENPAACRPQLRHRQCLLFPLWICLIWINRVDSSDAAKPLRLHRNRRGTGSRPRVFVIVALAPVIVRIFPRVGIKPLIFLGYLIFAVAM